MINTDQNKQLLQQIFAELDEGNAKLLVESMQEDFCWTITGNTKWSKTYTGKQVVLTELFAALRAKIRGRIRTVAHRFIAADDFVVVEAQGNNITNEGIPYCNSYCYIFQLANGKLKTLTEYMDTALVTAVLGDPEEKQI